MRGLSFYPLRFFSESIANTFKSRSKLFEFYKHTHPDVLTSAPERIKEENLRSLKILNNYLDNLSQNKGVQEQRLKFYIADKANNKAKKYFFFDANLQALKENVPHNLLSNHLDSCVSLLLEKLKVTKIESDPKLKKEFEKQKTWEQTKQESFEKEGQYTIKPIGKGSTIMDDRIRHLVETQMFNAMAFNSVHRQKLQSLMDTINDRLFYVDREEVKPKLWARILYQTDVQNDEIYKILSNLLDPRMIFFDKELKYDEITAFQKLLVPHGEKKTIEKRSRELKKVFSDMEMSNPQIMLYVSREYSIDRLPGCLTIPFHFKYSELVDFYHENKETLLKIREDYKSISNRVTSLQKQLLSEHKTNMIMPKTTNVSVLNSVLVVLKQILRVFEENQGNIRLLREIEIVETMSGEVEPTAEEKINLPLSVSAEKLKEMLLKKPLKKQRKT